MFFPERIKSITPKDRVLEIGPGMSPHSRSDIYLELGNQTPEMLFVQRGKTPEVELKKPIFYYDGKIFPFKDKEFDYVICSHVIEHVPNVAEFLKEMFRVGKRGYIEFPTVYWEYQYNFNCHLNFVRNDKGKLIYLPKEKTFFSNFLPIQHFFYNAISLYSDANSKIPKILFDGFEWEASFSFYEANNIEDLCLSKSELNAFVRDYVVEQKKSLLYKLTLHLTLSFRKMIKAILPYGLVRLIQKRAFLLPTRFGRNK